MTKNQAEMLYKIEVDMAKAVKDFETVAGKVKNINAQAASTGKALNGMQRNVQNVSFQLQDFIVQTTMGTDALRAFGQQAPQLLGGFGALGAALGVGFALLPAVVTLIKSMGNESKTLDEALKDVDKSMESLGESFKLMDRASFDSLVENYKKADVETRKLILSTIELNVSIAQLNQNSAELALTKGIEEAIDKLGFFKTKLLEVEKLVSEGSLTRKARSTQVEPSELLAGGLKTNEATAEQLRRLEADYKAATISANEYAVAVNKVVAGTKNPSKELLEYAKGISEASLKMTQLEQATKQLSDARARLAAGDLSTTKTIEQANAARDKELDAIVKEFEALEKLSQARTKEAEALMRSLDPLSSHTQALEKARILYNDNKLTAEEYAKAIDFANRKLADSDPLIRGAGQALSNAMTDIAFSGDSMNEVMNNMVESLAKVAYQVMIVQPLIEALKASMGAAGWTVKPTVSTAPPVPVSVKNANGNAFSGGNVIPFAKGGVVSSPMLFPMSGGQTGLMGEAGPEAIMPLKRGKDGKLGVAAGGSSTQVNIYNSNGGTVTTQERQDPNGGKIIDIMIKKAVASGIASGEFDKAMGSTYGLRRQGTR
jgi:HAMP domain-containing protein